MKKIVATCLITFVALTTYAQEQSEGGKKIELGEVVVTATKSPRVAEDIPIKTEVVKKEDIEESNAKNVGEAIKEVPGIFIRGENVPGGSSWTSTLRGLSFDSGYALVLVDGERTLGGGMGEYGISINQIPVEMIERIEIVKGPISSLYGSDALAGVVNIITKEPPTTPIFSINGGCGNYGISSFGAFYGRKIKRLGLLISAERETSRRGRYGASEDNFKGNYVLSKLSYEVSENLSLGLNTRYDRMTWNYSAEEEIRLSPFLRAILPDGSVTRLKGYWDKLNLNLFSPGYTPRTGEIVYLDIELQYLKPILEKHALTLGVEYLFRDINANFANAEDSFSSVYFQGEMNFPPIGIILGGRYDYFSLYGSQFNPKLAVIWKILEENLRLRAAVGRGFKSPTIRQLYVSFKHGNWWNLPNPELKPEVAWSYSIGIESEIRKRVFLGGEAFLTDVEDMIVRKDVEGETIEGVPVRTWENVQKARIGGVELQIGTELSKYFSLRLGYTYLYTKNRSVQKELPYSPPQNISGRVVFNVPQWGLSAIWITTFVDRVFTDPQNTSKINRYSISNFKIMKTLTNKVDIALEVDNIFESDYGEPDKEWLGRVVMGRVNVRGL